MKEVHNMAIKVGLKFIDLWGESMEDAVLQYEKEPIQKGQIVFYGPSNFTRWSEKWGMTPLRDVIRGKSGSPCAINRGFGSSCPEHQLYYYSRMIRPLEPKVLVYSTYDNGAAFGYSNEESWELAQRVIAYALTDFPDIHIYLSSANPRKNMTDIDIKKRRQYNSWLKNFAENTSGCYYLNAFDYEPLRHPENFVEDGIQFNAEGYQIYGSLMQEALKDELENF